MYNDGFQIVWKWTFNPSQIGKGSLLLSLWYSVNTHINAPDQRITKTSTFTEVLILAYDQ